MTFTYRLELADGSAADPPTFATTVYNWRPGDSIPLGRDRSLTVVATRPGAERDDAPVLVVEPDTADPDAA
jgi:hypothetical protein